MIRILFFNLVLVLCLMGCKCDKPGGVYLMTDEAIEYCPAVYGEGSYWVFQDRNTGELDTLLVDSQDWWGRLYGSLNKYECCESKPCYQYEYIDSHVWSNKFRFNLYIGGYPDNKKDGFALVTKKGGYEGYGVGGTFMEKKIDHGKYFSTIKIDSVQFMDVLLLQNPNGGYEDTILIARNIGPVHIHLRDSINLILRPQSGGDNAHT